MMVLQQKVWAVLVIKPHVTHSHPQRMWPTLIWTQFLGTASLAQTQTTDQVTVWNVQKKYQKREWASCRLHKGSLWTDAQLKRISNSHQAMWGPDHENFQTDKDCALAEDHNSFEMCKMMVRTDQLLYIAAATDSQIHTRDSEPKALGQAMTLVLLQRQYHTHYYHLHEKGMTRTMVDLQGLHSSDAFRLSNISSSVGLKSFFPLVLQAGGQHWNNSYPSEGSALLTTLQDHWPLLANSVSHLPSMSEQSILEHHLGCKTKHEKEHAEQE